ncbi:MAG TPA: methyl-accepting chemotaxis protein, partial [Burkholderiaceae bacterium]|nr:methyl-accepting chemotaxis protein [Burkholderiaceae bacterium]
MVATSPLVGGLKFGEFMHYTGPLTWGMRILNRWRLRTKAGVVTLAFLLPLVLMLGFIWQSARDQIAFAENERTGVAYLRPLLKLHQAAVARREAALLGDEAGLRAGQAAVRAAFAAVETQHRANPGMDTRFDTVSAAHQTLLNQVTRESPAATLAAHRAFLEALLALTREVADQSQLALDPDLDTYHMMNLAVLRSPTLYDSQALTGSLAAMASRAGQVEPWIRDHLVEGAAVRRMLDDEIENSYHQGITSAHAELAGKLDAPGAKRAAEALQGALDGLLKGQAGNADYLALGQATFRAQARLADEVLEALAAGLAARIEQLSGRLHAQLAVSVACSAAALFLLMSFIGAMNAGIREVRGHLQSMSQGNLCTQPAPWGADELSRMMDAVRDMQQGLLAIVRTVLIESDGVKQASQEIKEAAQDLSRRTEVTAANLEQTSASTASMAQTVEEGMQSLNEAAQHIQTNAQAAGRGGRAIEEVVDTMEGIRQSSSRIGEIIGVIDGIAFQTNILALNAAVE